VLGVLFSALFDASAIDVDGVNRYDTSAIEEVEQLLPRYREVCCRDPQPSTTLNPQPSTLDPPPSTLNPQPSALKPQPSTLDPRPSTLSPQTSTCNPQPSTLNP